MKARDEADRRQKFFQLQQPILNALGYQTSARELEIQPGLPVPIWQVFGEPGRPPHLIIGPTMVPRCAKRKLTRRSASCSPIHNIRRVKCPPPCAAKPGIA